MNPTSKALTDRLSNFLAALFVVFVLLFAGQGPLQELVRWIIPLISGDWEELSRRDQRMALKTGLIGGTFQFLKINFYSKTAVFLGMPLLFSLIIVALKFSSKSGESQPVLRWGLALMSLLLLGYWFVTVYARDPQLIWEPGMIDLLIFPFVTLLILYFTLREYGSFIVGFSVF